MRSFWRALSVAVRGRLPTPSWDAVDLLADESLPTVVIDVDDDGVHTHDGMNATSDRGDDAATTSATSAETHGERRVQSARPRDRKPAISSTWSRPRRRLLGLMALLTLTAVGAALIATAHEGSAQSVSTGLTSLWLVEAMVGDASDRREHDHRGGATTAPVSSSSAPAASASSRPRRGAPRAPVHPH